MTGTLKLHGKHFEPVIVSDNINQSGENTIYTVPQHQTKYALDNLGSCVEFEVSFNGFFGFIKTTNRMYLLIS